MPPNSEDTSATPNPENTSATPNPENTSATPNMENAGASLSVEDILRQVLEKMVSVPAPVSAGIASSHPLMDVIPEFDGRDLGDDAAVWCDLVEDITKDVTNQQRLSLATHALKGAAKRWYQKWKGNPRNWDKFRDDFCAVFVSGKKLHERLQRALSYTSDEATTYAQYARKKLTYFEETRVSFKPEEYIELVVGGIADQNVRTIHYQRTICNNDGFDCWYGTTYKAIDRKKIGTVDIGPEI